MYSLFIYMYVSGTVFRVYVAALIRPYVPMIFVGAFILGTGGGGGSAAVWCVSVYMCSVQ